MALITRVPDVRSKRARTLAQTTAVLALVAGWLLTLSPPSPSQTPPPCPQGGQFFNPSWEGSQVTITPSEIEAGKSFDVEWRAGDPSQASNMEAFKDDVWTIKLGGSVSPPSGGLVVFSGMPPSPTPGKYEFLDLMVPGDFPPGPDTPVTLYHGGSPVWYCPVTIKAPPTTAPPPPPVVPVQDFSVSCNPAALTAAPGGSAPSTCTVKSQGGFNQPVTLSCTGQPVGAACAFKPNPVSPPPNGSIDSALTVNVLGDAGTGDFKFQVVGTAGRVTRKAALGLTISLQPPPPPGPPIELPSPKGPEALELDRPSAEPGGDVNASGKGCDPNAPVELFMEGTRVGSGTADQAGDFDIPIKLPDSAGVGRHEVIAECGPTIETTVDVVVVARAESPGAPMGVLAVLIFFILEVRRLVRREGAVTPRR